MKTVLERGADIIFRLDGDNLMTNQGNVVIIKSGTLERNIRLPKEILALKKIGYNITLLSWDQTCESKICTKSDDCIVKELKLKAPKGIKFVLLFPIWWSFVLFHLFCIKFDVVHAIDVDSIIPAIIAGKLKKKPIIYEMIDICYYELTLPNWILYVVVYVDKLFMRVVDAVIFVDEMQVVGLDGVPNPNTFIIYDSPPCELLPNKSYLPNESYSNNDYFTLFYVGMFYRSKRLYLNNIVEAIKDVENVKLVIAGYGDLIDTIQQWVIDMPDKVEYIGRLNYSDVFVKGYTSDLMFVLRDPIILSNKFTCGSNMFNAMMLGKPILATLGTSTAEKVTNANCGIVINPSNIEEIKMAILKLKNDTKFCRNLGINAKKAYDNHYSWTFMENRLIDIYRNLN